MKNAREMLVIFQVYKDHLGFAVIFDFPALKRKISQSNRAEESRILRLLVRPLRLVAPGMAGRYANMGI